MNGVEGGGAGGVEGVAGSTETEGAGQQPGRKPGDPVIDGGDDGGTDAALPQQPFLESAAEPVPGQGRGRFAGQGEMADDDPDAAAVEGVRFSSGEGAVSSAQQQVKERIESGGEIGVDGEIFGQGAEIPLDIATLGGTDLIRGANPPIVDFLRFQQPAPLGGAAGAVDAVDDIIPEGFEGRRVGKDPAEADDRHRFSVLHAQAAPCSLFRWKLWFSEASMTHS